LVEVESCIISKNNICDKHFLATIGWKHVTMVPFKQENVLFFSTFCIILGVGFLSFHLVLNENTENGFFTQSLQHNSCYLSNDSVF
jgi:hypothetical protein